VNTIDLPSETSSTAGSNVVRPHRPVDAILARVVELAGPLGAFHYTSYQIPNPSLHLANKLDYRHTPLRPASDVCDFDCIYSDTPQEAHHKVKTPNH
jgi:hypothetical protein